MTRIVGITGGSGAGKTTIAHALAHLMDAPVIAEDDYYRCASGIADFDADAHNFDAPMAKEHDLLVAHLALAKRGAAFEKPLYDLTSHTRRKELERIEPSSALIVEGLHILSSPALRERFDFKVFVDADESVRLARRVVRDVASRDRRPESVVSQFFANVRPMHEAHVEPQRAFADLVLLCPFDAGPAHAAENAARILAAISQ